ncbi:MAG TPA: ATP-grasp fold amidoligase family protein [Bacilli bacterium]|nr:ATP-grasp fold amidoligase family protein [Bacilli bacterium]
MANPRFKENKIARFGAKTLQPFLRIFSKKAYISLQYRYITKHKLDWKALTRYTEKLQYLRLYYYDKNDDVIEAASRVGARERVTRLGVRDILIPIVGIYDRFEDIDFSTLPSSFVIKATHACAFNYICKDKSKVDKKALNKMTQKWLKTDYGKQTVEPHYSKIKPQLIVEHFISDGTSLPIEYKIHVFNGKAKYLYVVQNRGVDIRYDNFYIDFTPFPESQFNYWSASDVTPKKPRVYDKLVQYAEKLAHDFLFCRVDFFVVNNKIYFNEFTFTPAKGTLIFDEDKADFIISEWFDISSATKN